MQQQFNRSQVVNSRNIFPLKYIQKGAEALDYLPIKQIRI